MVQQLLTQVETSLFIELGLMIIIASILALLFKAIKQPVILAYLATGIVLTQWYVGDVSIGVFGGLAKIGVAFLLFLVGLSMDVRMFREVGWASLLTGSGQVIFTGLIGYGIALWLGFAPMTAFYICAALTFSSTIIIVKLLTDKNDLDALYGKIAVGFLLVQDIIVIVLLMVIVGLDNGTLGGWNYVTILIKGILLLLVAVLFHQGSKKYLHRLGNAHELLFLLVVAWCFFMALLAHSFGFSIEIGAFIAGVTLASVPFKLDVVHKVKPLRDFFLILFFVVLGTQMLTVPIQPLILPAILFSLFVLIGNPLIVMALMGLLGYKKRNSFLAGLTVAQISEFSLILVALGVGLGHVSEEILGLVTLIGLITITLSTYMITFADFLYEKCSPFLSVFERKHVYEKQLTLHTRKKRYDVVLIGYHRIGYNILEQLRRKKMRFLVVDYNPLVIRKLMEKKVPCLYGDLGDNEVLNEILKFKPKMIISTVHTFEDNLYMVELIKEKRKSVLVYATGRTIHEALDLYDAGANYVIIPHLLGGERVADLLKHTLRSKRQLQKVKKKHMRHLLSIDLPKVV